MTDEKSNPEGKNKKTEDTGSASQGSQPSGDDRSPKPRSRKQVSIPNIDEILTQLHQLNAAVLMGSMSVKDANFIQKNLKTLLDVQLKRANSNEAASPDQEALTDLCRRDPRSLAALEPFLSDEQIQTLMGEFTDPGDESL